MANQIDRYGTKVTPRRRRAYNRRAASDANADLARLVVEMGIMAERIRSFLDEHGETCSCGFCNYRNECGSAELDSVRHDLTGAAWTLETVTMLVSSIVLP